MKKLIYKINNKLNIQIINYIFLFVVLNLIIGCSTDESGTNIRNNYIYKEIKQINTKAVKLKVDDKINNNINNKTYFIIEVENTICPSSINTDFQNPKDYTDISIIGKGIVMNKKINDNNPNMEENGFIECFPYSKEFGSREGKSIIYLETDATINAGPITLKINKDEQIVTFNNYVYESPTVITNNKFQEIDNSIKLPVGNNETGVSNEVVLFIKPKDIKMYKRKIIKTEPNIKYSGYESINVGNTVNEYNTGFNTLNRDETSNYKITGYEDLFNDVVDCFQNKENIVNKTCGIKVSGVSKNDEVLNIAYNKSDKELTPDNTKIIVERNIYSKFSVSPKYKRLPEMNKEMYFLMDITSYNHQGDYEPLKDMDYEISFINNSIKKFTKDDYFKVDSIDSINTDAFKNSLAINFNKFFGNLLNVDTYGGIANLRLNVLENDEVNNALSESKIITKDMFEILPIRYFEMDNTPINNKEVLELENNKAYTLILRKNSFGKGKLFEISNDELIGKHVISKDLNFKINYDEIKLTDSLSLDEINDDYHEIKHCSVNSENDCYITININKNYGKNSGFESIKIPFYEKEYYSDMVLNILVK